VNKKEKKRRRRSMAGYDLSKTGAEHFARMYFIRSLNSLIIANTERSFLITFGLH
jgi:hypothetical protein